MLFCFEIGLLSRLVEICDDIDFSSKFLFHLVTPRPTVFPSIHKFWNSALLPSRDDYFLCVSTPSLLLNFSLARSCLQMPAHTLLLTRIRLHTHRHIPTYPILSVQNFSVDIPGKALILLLCCSGGRKGDRQTQTFTPAVTSLWPGVGDRWKLLQGGNMKGVAWANGRDK